MRGGFLTLLSLPYCLYPPVKYEVPAILPAVTQRSGPRIQKTSISLLLLKPAVLGSGTSEFVGVILMCMSGVRPTGLEFIG